MTPASTALGCQILAAGAQWPRPAPAGIRVLSRTVPWFLLFWCGVFGDYAVARPSGGIPPGSADMPTVEDEGAAKKELLGLIEELQVKLPSDLARKLSVISMKLYFGYCSPFEVKGLEDGIAGLRDPERKPFENEWKKVREHKCWPRMPHPKNGGAPKGRAPSSSGKPSSKPG